MIHDIAHVGHAELLSPAPEASLRFFVDVLGMDVEASEGRSVFLRGGDDYQRYSLKLTEAPAPGLGHIALRARSPEALARRAQALEHAGVGLGWSDGDLGHGPAFRYRGPDQLVGELYYEVERYVPTVERTPVLVNQTQRRPGRGAGVGRLDHVNLMSADVAACRAFAEGYLGFRTYERNVLDDGSEVGAWMSLSIAAHELVYVHDASGAPGRLHHLAFSVPSREDVLRAADLFLDHDVFIEAPPSKHAAAQAFFLYGYEPGGNRIEVTSGGYFVYDPDAEPIIRREAEIERGTTWGLALPPSFHTYGTPHREEP